MRNRLTRHKISPNPSLSERGISPFIKGGLRGIFLPFLLALLIVFPLGQLSRIPLPWPEVRIYWHDLAVMALLVNGLIVLLVSRKRFRWPRLSGPILIFWVTALVSLLVNAWRFSLAELVIGSLYLWRWLAYAGIYFILVQASVKQKAKVIEYLILAGAAAAVLGLLQYIFYPNAWPLVADNWDPHVGRVIGTYLDPGFTGLIYALTLILLVVRGWDKALFKSPITNYQLLITLVYLAMLLTYSRSAYLAFLVGVGAIAWVKRSPKFFTTVLLIFLLSLTFLPRPHGEGTKLERVSTAWSRIENWRRTGQIIRQSPVLGIGFDLYRYQQRREGFLGDDWQVSHAGAGADSSLLFVWATTGLLGLTAYLWLWKKIIFLAWRSRRGQFGLVLLASSLAVLTHSFFNNSLFYAWVMLWLWFAAGVNEAKNAKPAR